MQNIRRLRRPLGPQIALQPNLSPDDKEAFITLLCQREIKAITFMADAVVDFARQENRDDLDFQAEYHQQCLDIFRESEQELRHFLGEDHYQSMRETQRKAETRDQIRGLKRILPKNLQITAGQEKQLTRIIYEELPPLLEVLADTEQEHEIMKSRAAAVLSPEQLKYFQPYFYKSLNFSP